MCSTYSYHTQIIVGPTRGQLNKSVHLCTLDWNLETCYNSNNSLATSHVWHYAQTDISGGCIPAYPVAERKLMSTSERFRVFGTRAFRKGRDYEHSTILCCCLCCSCRSYDMIGRKIVIAVRVANCNLSQGMMACDKRERKKAKNGGNPKASLEERNQRVYLIYNSTIL